MTEKKKFDPTFAFYNTKTGTGFSAIITQEMADFVTANVGGRLFIKERTDRKHDRIPNYEGAVLPASGGSGL